MMKHMPNGREGRKTAKDWDPRTHDRKNSANNRRTSAKISTRNALREWVRCCPRATRGGNTRRCVPERTALERVRPGQVQPYPLSQTRRKAVSVRSCFGWCKRQGITEMRPKAKRRQRTRPRMVWRTSRRSSSAVTDADENMV